MRNTLETFRCRIYQAPARNYTRSELLAIVATAGDFDVTIRETFSSAYCETHAVTQPRLGHTFRLLNAMVREGLLKRTDVTRPAGRSTFGETPERVIARFTR